MKKLLLLLMSFSIMVLFLVGCGGSNNESVYKDGTYSASADPWQFGSEDATIVIKDGKISEVTLRRLDTEGNEVNYDDWQGQTVNNATYPNLKQYRLDMAKSIIDNQSTSVDTISGATTSTANWKIAVDRALEKAKS